MPVKSQIQYSVNSQYIMQLYSRREIYFPQPRAMTLAVFTQSNPCIMLEWVCGLWVMFAGRCGMWWKSADGEQWVSGRRCDCWCCWANAHPQGCQRRSKTSGGDESTPSAGQHQIHVCVCVLEWFAISQSLRYEKTNLQLPAGYVNEPWSRQGFLFSLMCLWPWGGYIYIYTTNGKRPGTSIRTKITVHAWQSYTKTESCWLTEVLSVWFDCLVRYRICSLRSIYLKASNNMVL